LWTVGSKIPLDFTSVPEHYVLDKKLILCDCQILTEEDIRILRSAHDIYDTPFYKPHLRK